jgi:hypothetical protein
MSGVRLRQQNQISETARCIELAAKPQGTIQPNLIRRGPGLRRCETALDQKPSKKAQSEVTTSSGGRRPARSKRCAKVSDYLNLHFSCGAWSVN